jgi:trigger factor
LDEVVKSTELPGFRKGMAPKEMVAEKSDVSKLYGEVINELLQRYYPQALKENLITPISNPKVEIKEFNLEKEFEFVATVATRPEVKVGEFCKYFGRVQEKKEKTTKEENAKKLVAGEKLEDSHAHLTPNEVIDILIDASELDVPELLIEEETERMMSRLVDQAQSIGLSLEQYLKAQNKTSEQLRSEYSKIAERSLKAEFILSNLANTEKIEVTDTEIEDVAKASGNPEVLEQLKDPVQKWYIKSILEKNKLISKLTEEAAHEK